jgi:hypothetical protein
MMVEASLQSLYSGRKLGLPNTNLLKQTTTDLQIKMKLFFTSVSLYQPLFKWRHYTTISHDIRASRSREKIWDARSYSLP